MEPILLYHLILAKPMRDREIQRQREESERPKKKKERDREILIVSTCL